MGVADYMSPCKSRIEASPKLNDPDADSRISLFAKVTELQNSNTKEIPVLSKQRKAVTMPCESPKMDELLPKKKKRKKKSTAYNHRKRKKTKPTKSKPPANKVSCCQNYGGYCLPV